MWAPVLRKQRTNSGNIFFLASFLSFFWQFFCLRQWGRCCDVSACVEETKNKQRKYGDQPHRQAREEGNGQKGWNYNFGKNRSRTKRPPAKNGRFWAGAGRAVGRLSLLEIYEEVKIWKIIVFHSRDKRSGARGAKRALPSSCHNPDSWWYKYQKGIPRSLCRYSGTLTTSVEAEQMQPSLKM